MSRPYRLVLASWLGYVLLNALGFGIAYHAFGISYSDPRLLWAGLPMMVLCALYVVWLLRGHIANSVAMPTTGLERWLHRGVRAMGIVACVCIALGIIEGIVRGFPPLVMLSTLVLCLLIGFSEEGLHRRFIIDTIPHPLFAVILSAVLFGVLHMTTVAGGTGVGNAAFQSFNALLPGCGLAVLYVACRRIVPLILWHSFTDFNLSLDQQGTVYVASTVSVLVDALFIITLILAAVLLFKRYTGSSRTSAERNLNHA